MRFFRRNGKSAHVSVTDVNGRDSPMTQAERVRFFIREMRSGNELEPAWEASSLAALESIGRS